MHRAGITARALIYFYVLFTRAAIQTSPLPKNKSKIELLLTQMPTLPEIIAISETKLNSSNRHLVDIKNYNFVHSDSLTNAGSVGIYIRKDLSYCIILTTTFRWIIMTVKAYLLKY